jgi:hypothetical protein
MQKSDEDVFSFANDEWIYVFTLFKTENEHLPIEFEQGTLVNILSAIPIDENVEHIF